jgi:putative FmdB family regulatory protein
LGQAIGLESGRKVEALREVAMPQYEYLCLTCHKKFSAVLTLAAHEKGKVKCPKCKSTKVEQQWAAFYATTSKKS